MNSANANQATVRVMLWSLAGLAGFFLAAWMGRELGGFILSFWKVFVGLWVAFLLAVAYVFRDPDPIPPSDLNAVVSPAFGRVDMIEDCPENEYLNGPSKRVSIRVGLMDPQIQYAPVTGTADYLHHVRPMTQGGGAGAENLFIGFEVIGRTGVRMAVRLIAGTWGRRIAPWIQARDVVERSARLGMMRPGRRVDLYLPPQIRLYVNPGDEVAGGQTVVAKFE